MKKWIPSCYMMIAAFFYSLQYLDVKTISSYYGIWMIAFSRGITSLFLCVVSLAIQKKRVSSNHFEIFGKKKKSLLARGILGGLAISSSFLAIKYLNLSIATVIISTSPILTCIMSYFFQQTNWTKWDTLTVFICFTGLVIISIKGFTQQVKNFRIGFLAAICSSFFTALVNITIHDIKDENTLTITLYSMGSCSLITLPGLFYESLDKDFVFDANIHIFQLCLAGVLSFSAQFLKTKSIQLSENLGIIVLRYLDIIFCILWDIFLLGSTIDIYNGIGIICIFTGCCLKIILSSYT
jgi:drug/metabolite transporter (DMT)-like permease